METKTKTEKELETKPIGSWVDISEFDEHCINITQFAKIIERKDKDTKLIMVIINQEIELDSDPETDYQFLILKGVYNSDDRYIEDGESISSEILSLDEAIHKAINYIIK